MIVSTSILNSNLLHLGNDIRMLEKAGTDYIHIDIMDGQFVEARTYSDNVVAAITDEFEIPVEVHLMIQKPEEQIDNYIQANPDLIFIHPESTVYVRKLLLKLKRAGIKTGIALKLDTPLLLDYYIDLVDVVLLVTCDEGFGGQSFQPLALNKIKALQRLRTEKQLQFLIEVDGGINYDTGKLCKEAGADILVSGSYILKSDYAYSIHKLRNLSKI